MSPSLLQPLLPLSMFLAVTAAQAGCELMRFDIPVHVVDRRPIATLKINGTEVRMLVDSGAFFSMLSASTATQLNLPVRNLPAGMRISGYTGKIEAQRTVVDKLGLLGAELPNVDFLVGGNELGAGIMGVLGRNILSTADTEYDLAHGVVRLSHPRGDCDTTNFAYWAGEAPVVVVPLERQDRGDTSVRVKFSINGINTVALLDTGAPRTSLTLRAASRAGIEERDLKPLGRVGGVGEGHVKSWTGVVATIELGGEKISNSRLQIDEVSSDQRGMILGLDYFLSHRIYVSRLQRQIYVTWNGSPIFAPAGAAAGDLDKRYAATPQDVEPDDADALARRGAAALAAGNFQRALEDLNRACALAPDVAEHLHTRARLHLAMRQPRLALVDLDQVLRLDPAQAEARMRRAGVRAGFGERAGAQNDLAQLDTGLPPSHNLRAGMGQLHASFGDVPEALRQFDMWVTTHPLDARLASILNGRCWLRARLNIELSLALQDCKAAVDKDGGEAAHHDSLAWTQLRLGDAAAATKSFDRAIQLQALPSALYGRGLAKSRLNDATGAESDLAAARKLKASIDMDVRKAGFEFAEAKEFKQP